MEPTITFDDLSNFGDQIRTCETFEDLSLYHYKTIDENADPIFKQARGVVFNKEGKLIMRGFPFTPEYTHDNPNLSQKIGQLYEYIITPSYEGTILRVFNYKDRWFVSTHKKLFANTSYWADRKFSFEELFQQSIDAAINEENSILKKFMNEKGILDCNYNTFFTCLEKNKQYMFLISPTNENRIVSYSPCSHPSVLHVGTFTDNSNFSVNDYIGLPLPVKIEHIKTVEELSTFVASFNPMFCQGVFLMSPKGFVKIVNKMYSFLHDLRGNQPNLELRFLELINEGDKLQSFVQLYYEYQDRFNAIQKSIETLIKNLHNVYVRRYVQKEIVFASREEHLFLVKLHNTFINTRIKTTAQRISELLSKEDPLTIYRMIKN